MLWVAEDCTPLCCTSVPGTAAGLTCEAAAAAPPPQLPEVMSYLHDRGVKGYVVVNVLGEPT